MNSRRSWDTEALQVFRSSFRRFLEGEFVAKAASWRAQRCVDREAWLALGQIGALCPDVPEEFGGAGGTFADVAAIIEELERNVPELAIGVTVHNAIVAQYLLAYGSTEQKRRWLPELAAGHLIGAIAMSEPDAGSDLQNLRTHAQLTRKGYVLNGQKTFITNGQIANLVIVAAKTERTTGPKGLSLLVVEADQTDGFRRGRKLNKIGLHASDTSELFFDDAVVPPANLLGAEGSGFAQLMEQLPKERLALAIQAVTASERAIDITADYAKRRTVFGAPIMSFQNTAFTLAERKTEAVVARVFIDWCIDRVVSGELDPVTAAMAKWWTTAKQIETVDDCVQLHGGYGYMDDSEIARRFIDARAQAIYGGTNEIMKLIVSQSL